MKMLWRMSVPLLIGSVTGCDDGQKAQDAAQLRETSMANMV